MTEAAQSVDVNNVGRKRNPGRRKGKSSKKRQRTMMPQGGERKVKINQKTRKLFQKRARDYNSDGEDEDEDDAVQPEASVVAVDRLKKSRDGENSDDGEEENLDLEGEEGDEGEVSEDENGGIQPGIIKFAEGIKAYKLAFKKIVKKSVHDDELWPVLAANKMLLAEKLAEEDEENKSKGAAKKEKHLLNEKGHEKPPDTLDAHEKLLLGVATKGVVKLFNAVNKAQHAQKGFNPSRAKDEKVTQHAQKGFNPSRAKDEKVIKQRRKEAFFSELGSTSTKSVSKVAKVGTSGGYGDGEAPLWLPLRDNYMLTNPKLKDWDKMQDTNGADDFGRASNADSSSDDE